MLDSSGAGAYAFLQWLFEKAVLGKPCTLEKKLPTYEMFG